MCKRLKNEVKRALRVLRTLEDRFNAILAGLQTPDCEQQAIIEQVGQTIKDGLAETKDEQAIWRAHDSAEVKIIGLMGSADIDGLCERMLTRLSSGRFLDEPAAVAKRLCQRLEDLRKEAQDISCAGAGAQVPDSQMESLRKRTAHCIGNVFELMQVKVGRKRLQEEVLNRFSIYGVLCLVGFVLASNAVLAPPDDESPNWLLILLFGRGTRLAIVGAAGAVVARGAAAVKRPPNITTLLGALAAHRLGIVVGGILGIAVIHLVRSKLLLADLADVVGEPGNYMEHVAFAFSFAAGLLPGAVTRLVGKAVDNASQKEG